MSNSTKSKSSSKQNQSANNMAKSTDQMKYEVAEEFGINLGASASARDNGKVGGEITRRLVKLAQGQTSEEE